MCDIVDNNSYHRCIPLGTELVSQYSLGSTTVFVFDNVVLCRIDKWSFCHSELVDGRLLRVEGEESMMF